MLDRRMQIDGHRCSGPEQAQAGSEIAGLGLDCGHGPILPTRPSVRWRGAFAPGSRRMSARAVAEQVVGRIFELLG